MSDNEPDECGIKPLTFRGWVKNQCAWHDRAYVKGSWHQLNLSRKQVDEHFLTMMLEDAQGNIPKRVASYVMYGLTRIFGGFFWEGKR